MDHDSIFDSRWNGDHGIGRFASEVRARLNGVRDLDLDGNPSSAFDPVRLGLHLRRTKPRVFVTPGFNVPLSPNCPIVLTIHDLIPIVSPSRGSTLRKLYFYLLQRPTVRTSEVTFTVSEFSKSELVRFCGVAQDKIVVLGNGVSKDFEVNGKRKQSKRPYYICVSNSKPHKNLKFLIRAFEDFSREFNCDLVVVCKPNPDLLQDVAILKLQSRVQWVNGLSDAELAELYRGATGLIMPSLYEGFGLPVVEAMACGCPVLCSNRTSLPEIAGPAALYFDPTDVNQLVSQMKLCYSERAQLAKKVQLGIDQAALFTWDRVAKRMQDALAQHRFIS